ncbi:MAG: ComF family protein [Rhodocyclales bacterium]|nr:ComF family protein [Rhodocyclales bacterium]
MVPNLSNVLASVRTLTSALTGWLAPHACFVCGATGVVAPVCAACDDELPRLGDACPVCATPTLDAQACGRCLREPPAYDTTVALFEYRLPVDRMVQALKYRHRLALAAYFSRLMAGACRPDRPVDMILPMPLHGARLRERGFNQAVELARPLARAWGLPLELARVERVSNVAPQASLPWKARRLNMRGAFGCHGSLEGKKVLVVDDVMTTGATLDALASLLKRHGAARVDNLVVARTLPPDG